MELVGRYRIDRRIGAGAFSTVWLAHDDALDIPVAIKILSDNWIDHAEVRTRFLDEARLLRRISDPHVIGVHDLGTLADGRDYFVMDYADEGTLADRAEVPMPAPEAVQLSIELAHGVAALHRHGVLHRDLKPANILLSRVDGATRPLIADLGMAKRLAEASGLTVAAGTPGYMAPEQARGVGLDERTDVYGIAAVCYRLLTGELPFGSTAIAAVANRSPDELPPALPPGSPPGLNDLLRSALSSDPELRPSSASALADELQTVAGTRPVAADAPALVRDPASSAAVRGPGRPGLPTSARAAGITLLALAVAAATWLALSLLIAR